MQARLEFETMRGQLLHQLPLPTPDIALVKIIAEETQLRMINSFIPSQPTIVDASATFVLTFVVFSLPIYSLLGLAIQLAVCELGSQLAFGSK